MIRATTVVQETVEFAIGFGVGLGVQVGGWWSGEAGLALPLIAGVGFQVTEGWIVGLEGSIHLHAWFSGGGAMGALTGEVGPYLAYKF